MKFWEAGSIGARGVSCECGYTVLHDASVPNDATFLVHCPQCGERLSLGPEQRLLQRSCFLTPEQQERMRARAVRDRPSGPYDNWVGNRLYDRRLLLCP